MKKAWADPTTSKSTLFAVWKDKTGDWLEVCYEVGLIVRTTDSVSSQYKLKTRSQLEETIGDAAVVAEMIAEKTAAGQWIAHPDAPHKVEARLYFCFDTTTWDHASSQETMERLHGRVSNVAPSDALMIANRMQDQSSLQGPHAFAKAPQLNMTFHTPAAPHGATSEGGTSATKGTGKGKGRKGTTPSTKTPRLALEADGVVPPPKAPKKVTADVFFKTLRAVLDNLNEIGWLKTALAEKGSEGEPFSALLTGHHTKLSAAYEGMRIETTNTSMNTDNSVSDRTATGSGDLGPGRQGLVRDLETTHLTNILSSSFGCG